MSMHAMQPRRRRIWPAILLGVLAAAVAVALVTVFLVRRDDKAAADSQLTLAEGVTAGGSVTGQARSLAEALVGRGLECSARFTSAEGGHAGCFAYQAAGRTSFSVIYQYGPDGTVIAFLIKITGDGDTGAALRSLSDTVGPVVFPADLANVNDVLDSSGFGMEGQWGKYDVVPYGNKRQVGGQKLGTQQIKVPVLHLDTAEPALANDLTADGYTCTPDNETCQRKPGFALKFSGPDTGITYLVATAANGSTTDKAFDELKTTVFGHLHGAAVAPVQDWVSQHLDGRSHAAYVAGWRVDLEVAPGKQIRLTLFNEEIWLVMT